MRKLFRRIHHLLNRQRLERELDDEMSAHREMMPPERRSLNLSTAVGIAAYEALRQVGFGLPGGRADTPS